MGRFVDLTGRRFWRLTVRHRTTKQGAAKPVWLCQCDCGTVTTAYGYSLKNGHTQSCGCLHRERASTAAKINSRTHGMKNTPEWHSWSAMLSRCRNPNATGYDRYGGRGIRVAKRWEKFENFYADMGPRPSKAHSLDRKDSNGHYKPDNCRWASRTEQANNRRDSAIVVYHGEQMPLHVAWTKSGSHVSKREVRRRMRFGWTVERALDTPVHHDGTNLANLYYFQGKPRTLRQIEGKTGVPREAIARRLKLGWPIDLAASVPNKRGNRLASLLQPAN